MYVRLVMLGYVTIQADSRTLGLANTGKRKIYNRVGQQKEWKKNMYIERMRGECIRRERATGGGGKRRKMIERVIGEEKKRCQKKEKEWKEREKKRAKRN